MKIRKKIVLPWYKRLSLKLRPFKNNRDGVSNVLGYTFSLSVAAILMVSAIFIFNGVIDDKTNEVAGIEAQNIANYVANAIAEAISIKETMPEANYYKTLDLPEKIAGKKYSIEVTNTEVFVRTVDGRVSKSCSTYYTEGLDSGIAPSVIRSNNDGLTLSYDEMDYIFKFDFGKGNILSHSPVEAGYYMVSPEEGPEWYQDMPYRIPINITNPSDKEIEDTPIKIVLNETNFDYDRVTFNDGNTSGDFNAGGSSVPQPNIFIHDPELSIENEIEISASINPSTWYPYWKYSRINIDSTGPFTDPDDIMEIEKDTFKVLLTLKNDPDGPNSEYVWYDSLDEPPPHPIRFGPAAGEKIDCINYTPNYGSQYVGMAEFTYEDAFTTIPFFGELENGNTQEIEIEGYFLDKTKFYTTCNITIKDSDIYVDDDGDAEYTKVQDAINNAVPGDTIYVYPGIYNEQIVIDKEINLFGNLQGQPPVIDGTNKDDFVVKVTADNVNISSFVITNGGTSDDSIQTDGLELDGCSNVRVTECDIKDNQGRGIFIYNGANMNIIRKCISHNNLGHYEDGYIRDGDGLVITNNNNYGTKYNYILDSQFINCNNYDTDGIVIMNGADYNKIENCNIEIIGGNDYEDWSKGIDIVTLEDGTEGPSNNLIKNCDISDVSGKYIAGIGIWNNQNNNDQSKPINNKIIGGNIYSINGIGIALYWTDNNKIRDVKIHGNYGGIWTLDADNNLIDNCKIYDNLDRSFTFNPFLPESKNNGDGIYFDLFSDFNTVRNCDIYNNEGVGINIADVDDTYSDNNTIEYCNIYNNGGTLIKNGAILLSFASNTIIRYCNIYDNSRNGISIYFSDYSVQNENEGNQIYNNNIYRNEQNGILLLTGTRFNDINHNNIYWNGMYGVKIGLVTVSNSNEIHNNNFVYNNGAFKEAYDGTLSDDDWANNYWKGHPGGEYEIETPPLFPTEKDPTPLGDMVNSKIIVLDNSEKYLFDTIKDAVNNVQTDGIIQVYGTYKISSSIEIDKRIKFIGNDATIIYTGIDAAAINVQVAGVEINSLDIQGPSQNQEGVDGILVTEGDSVIINNCKIHSFYHGIHILDNGVRVTNCIDIYSNTNGILIEGVDYNQINNCSFYNNKNGIKLLIYSLTKIPENNFITDCDFNNNDNGVHLDGADSNIIERCKFEGNAVSGIRINGGSKFNEIKKCMIEDNEYGVYIMSGCSSNSIYYNHFTGNSQNAYDAGSNNWDYDGRGNYWDDYLGLDKDYDGIGDDSYPINGGGANTDRYPISASGRYIESIRPFSVEYWNPSGESIILVNMDLKPKQSKIIYLYYGFEEMDSIVNTGLRSIAVAPDAFKPNVGVLTKDQVKWLQYEIPTLEDPDPIEGDWTKNEIMYVVESRLKIEDLPGNENQANIILLSQDTADYDNSYLVSINTSYTKEQNPKPNNDLYSHKNPSQDLLDSSNLPKSMEDKWLLLKSFIFISKNYFDENSVNYVNISTFIYDYDTYTTLGSSSYTDTSGAYLNGYVGIGCGLLGEPFDITDGKIIVDWFRVRKTPVKQPIIKIGSMESRNSRWINAYDQGKDSEGITPFKPGPVLRDYNCGSIFSVGYLPSGTYTIIVSSGGFDEIRNEMTVIIDPDYSTNPPIGIATIVFPATTNEREFETRSTTFDWPGGILKIGFTGCDCGGGGPSTGRGLVNAITIARGQEGIRLIYGR